MINTFAPVLQNRGIFTGGHISWAIRQLPPGPGAPASPGTRAGHMVGTGAKPGRGGLHCCLSSLDSSTTVTAALPGCTGEVEAGRPEEP